MRLHHLWFFLPGRFLSCFGPVQSFLGVTAFPECPGMGQCLPERQREQFSIEGSSTTLRSRPYFRLGMTVHRVDHSMKMAHTLWLMQR
jgi:hypothetical protein